MFNIDFSSQKAKPLSLDESSKLLQDQEKKHKVGYIISQFFFHGYIEGRWKSLVIVPYKLKR